MRNEDIRYMNTPLPEDVQSACQAGDEALAHQLIEGWLSQDISAALQARLRCEQEFLPLRQRAYPLNEAALLQQLQARVKDFQPEELEGLRRGGWLDTCMVKGERRYMEDTVSSLIKANRSLAMRSDRPFSPGNPRLDEVVARAEKEKELSLRVRLRIQMAVAPEAFSARSVYRVHMPIPKPGMAQDEVRVLDCTPTPRHIARESAPQRTAYFEETLTENTPFVADVCYRQHLRYVDLLDGEPFIAYPDAAAPTAEDLKELPPHLVFTPFLRALAAQIRGDEVIPARIAWRIYEYITTHVRYAYVRPYLMIENGAEYTAVNLRGDCGLQTLLFIALCRICGIPARWESGLIVEPDYIGSHDWAQFYTESWGWLGVDCSFGGGAWRRGNARRHRFYFGNLDPYRMAANSAYMASLQPAKEYLRNDPYDNQRGECETPQRGLLAHEYRTKFVLQSLDFAPSGEKRR